MIPGINKKRFLKNNVNKNIKRNMAVDSQKRF